LNTQIEILISRDGASRSILPMLDLYYEDMSAIEVC